MPAPARKRRLHLATPILVAALLIPGPFSAAGTASDAEITDVAGDSNFINGQGLVPGQEVGPDTRPASFDNVDLRAVWFETAFTTSKILDPASGAVLRVEHRPTALLVHVQTQGPARPMSPWSTIHYKIAAILDRCPASFELDIFGTPPERASIRPHGTPCDGGPSGRLTSPVTPTFEGAVSTMTFPLDQSAYGGLDVNVAAYIRAGRVIGQPVAHVTVSPGGGRRPDETITGRDFTIGQDVPADIDCTNDPENPQCQA